VPQRKRRKAKVPKPTDVCVFPDEGGAMHDASLLNSVSASLKRTFSVGGGCGGATSAKALNFDGAARLDGGRPSHRGKTRKVMNLYTGSIDTVGDAPTSDDALRPTLFANNLGCRFDLNASQNLHQFFSQPIGASSQGFISQPRLPMSASQGFLNQSRLRMSAGMRAPTNFLTNQSDSFAHIGPFADGCRLKTINASDSTLLNSSSSSFNQTKSLQSSFFTGNTITSYPESVGNPVSSRSLQGLPVGFLGANIGVGFQRSQGFSLGSFDSPNSGVIESNNSFQQQASASSSSLGGMSAACDSSFASGGEKHTVVTTFEEKEIVELSCISDHDESRLLLSTNNNSDILDRLTHREFLRVLTARGAVEQPAVVTSIDSRQHGSVEISASTRESALTNENASKTIFRTETWPLYPSKQADNAGTDYVTETGPAANNEAVSSVINKKSDLFSSAYSNARKKYGENMLPSSLDGLTKTEFSTDSGESLDVVSTRLTQNGRIVPVVSTGGVPTTSLTTSSGKDHCDFKSDSVGGGGCVLNKECPNSGTVWLTIPLFKFVKD